MSVPKVSKAAEEALAKLVSQLLSINFSSEILQQLRFETRRESTKARNFRRKNASPREESEGKQARRTLGITATSADPNGRA